MTSAFAGFPAEAVGFLDGLEANNNRDWFQANRSVYERACRQPMIALLAELEPAFGPSKVFRINRDVRFSADKSPYKTSIAGTVGRNYVALSTEGLYVGGGVYRPDGPTLARLRSSIDEERSGAELARLIAGLRRKGYDVDTHETLRTAPKGYAKDHPRIELLRMKDVFAGRGFAPEPWLSTREAFRKVKRVLSDVKPLNDWLERHVG